MRKKRRQTEDRREKRSRAERRRGENGGSPWAHVVLERLQARLDQVQRLEEQRGAGAAQGAAHEGFQSRVGLGATGGKGRGRERG